VTLSGSRGLPGASGAGELTCPDLDDLNWSVHPGSLKTLGERETLYAHSTQAGRKGTSTTVTAEIWSASTSE
jgi:hypothetical protein